MDNKGQKIKRIDEIHYFNLWCVNQVIPINFRSTFFWGDYRKTKWNHDLMQCILKFHWDADGKSRTPHSSPPPKQLRIIILEENQSCRILPVKLPRTECHSHCAPVVWWTINNRWCFHALDTRAHRSYSRDYCQNRRAHTGHGWESYHGCSLKYDGLGCMPRKFSIHNKSFSEYSLKFSPENCVHAKESGGWAPWKACIYDLSSRVLCMNVCVRRYEYKHM